MKEWIAAVTVSCMVLSVLSLLLSEGNTKKYVLGAARLVILILICSPILKLFTQKEIFFPMSNDYIETEENVSSEKAFLCVLCENDLRKKGIECTVCLTEEGGEKYADIFTDLAVISEDEGNIYKNSEAVIKSVTKYLPVEKEQIRVWAK